MTPMPPTIELILTATDDAGAEAWRTFCGNLAFIRVHQGSILDLTCDAIVSPANSFGFMDGGIDALYLDHFGHELGARVRERIERYHHGELLVGSADIVATGSVAIPWLIVAPTMRVPMRLHDSVNPYLAARAVFLLALHGAFRAGAEEGRPVSEHVRSIAMPGLGTGVGGIGINTCAHQVRAAIDAVLLDRHDPPASWAEASERHQLLYTDRPRRLQR